MRRTLAPVLAVLALLLASVPVAAYELRGTDPDDREAIGADPDLRSSILRVGRGAHGRVLVVVVRAYETLGDYWTIQVWLDAQDGRRADHTMLLWNADTGGAGCWVRERGQGNPSHDGVFRQRGRAARCRVPIRLVEPDRTIRWRLSSPSGYVDGNEELAPDHGMYG